jgi:dihydroflavonol-4-reductase
MRVAITGATGLLGGNLARLLVHQGHDVVATRRATSRTEHLDDLDLTWREADLGDPEALRAAFSGADVVFHCAAAVTPRYPPPDWVTEVNVAGTAHVLDAVRAERVERLVHCSTVATLGISTTLRPVDEWHDFNLPQHGIHDGYAETKLRAERLVSRAASRGLDAVIVQPGYMFGPYDAKPSSGQMIVEIARERLPATSPGYNNFVDVRDVARGMVAAWERGRRGERYILGGYNMRYPEIMERIARIADVSPPRLILPEWLARLGGRLGDLKQAWTDSEVQLNSTTIAYGYNDGYRFTSERARRELGYEVGPLDVSIRDALDWFRDHDML